MVKFDSARFMRLTEMIHSMTQQFTAFPGGIPFAIQSSLAKFSTEAQSLCRELGMLVSAEAAKQTATCDTGEELVTAVECLRRTIHIEAQQKSFWGVEPRLAHYFQNANLFGEEVFNAFPSANEDIQEAGTCLAFERGTACVMHLSRVMEVGLKSLAAGLGIANQNDWGAYLNKIESELTRRAKTSGNRTMDEQFYSEAQITFDSIRRAWRNPTMHVEKTHTLEQSEDILIAVRSFMRHLATKICE
jgi:hypothetical protein